MSDFLTGVEDSLTERIKLLCHKLEHYNFLSEEDRAKILSEVKILVEQRNKLRETIAGSKNAQ